MRNLIFALFISAMFSSTVYAFEVKAKATSFTLCVAGQCEVSNNNDAVIYEVDEEKSVVIRKAVVNVSIKDPTLGGGLQSDNTPYQIVYDQQTSIVPYKNAKPVSQRIIKAIGQTGTLDGFETIVIGEDFIITSRSTTNYFVIYQYKRLE